LKRNEIRCSVYLFSAENVLGGEVYVSDDETGFSSPVTQRVHQLPKQKDQKME
jgi:hypothetical protein